MNLVWLTNMSKDPQLAYPGKSPQEAYMLQKQYLMDKRIGSPKSTEHYSTQELISMGMVGVYKVE